MARRTFTLDEAQALLPRVRSSLGQGLQLHAHLRTRLAALEVQGLEISWAVLRGEEALERTDTEATDGLARAQGIYSTLRALVAELEGLGVEVKSVTGGLVDFHSYCDGETEVLLSYSLGEAQITHFYGLEDSFDERRPVAGHRFTREPDRHEADGESAQAPSPAFPPSRAQ